MQRASERAPHSREGKGREGQIGEETCVSARRGRGRLLALRWQWSRTSDTDPAEDEEEEIDKLPCARCPTPNDVEADARNARDRIADAATSPTPSNAEADVRSARDCAVDAAMRGGKRARPCLDLVQRTGDGAWSALFCSSSGDAERGRTHQSSHDCSGRHGMQLARVVFLSSLSVEVPDWT